MRKTEPIHLIVHYPKTEAEKLELAQRVAQVHANAVNQRLKALNCPEKQKLALLEAVIDTVKKRPCQPER